MNALVKLIERESPQMILSDFSVFQALSPLAYYLYLSLLNAKKGFSPTMKWVDYQLKCTRKTSLRVIGELETKGLLDRRQTGYDEYVWAIRYTFKEDEQKHVKKAKNDNSDKIRELQLQIEAREILLEQSNGAEYEKHQNELIRLKTQLKELE